jgi:hypothetical protein
MDGAKNSAVPLKKKAANQAKPEIEGTGWMFPLLMAIIGLGVLGILLKSLGLI